jgi:hypothetical protein
MTINVWFNSKTNEYNVKYGGKHYVRTSYTAAKELIDQLIPNMVAVTKYA